MRQEDRSAIPGRPRIFTLSKSARTTAITMATGTVKKVKTTVCQMDAFHVGSLKISWKLSRPLKVTVPARMS